MEKEKKPSGVKLALCLIVKGTDREAELLGRCLQYTASFVDGVFVTITQPNEKVEQMAKLYGANVSYFAWVNDFAKARNFNFSQVPKDYTHIFWLDSDDIVRGIDKLRSAIESHPHVDAFSMFYLYAFDEYNNPTVVHHKTRVLKNDGCVSWAGSLHEDFKENRKVTTFFIKDIEVLHLTDEQRIHENKERNLAIAEVEAKEMPDDPRSWWNMGNALKALGRDQEAIDAFDKFLADSESDDEKYIVYLRRAEAYWGMGDRNKALDEGRYALGLKPEFPDAYNLLGALHYELRQYAKAVDYLKQGLSLKAPYYKIIVYNPRDYDYVPLMNLAKAYFALSLPSLSLECLKACALIYPEDKHIEELIKTMEVEAGRFEEVLKIVEKVKDLRDEKKIEKELEKVPDDLKMHPAICNLRNTRLIKKTATGRDLVFYCGPQSEEWTPETVKEKGIGGSEEAIINLSAKLADMGWNVTVYNNCGFRSQKFGKVTYKPFWSWNYRDRQDVVIIWRVPLPLDYPINSPRVYLDLHDTIEPGELNEKRVNVLTKIFVKSNFHRSLYPNVPDEKFVIIPNGFDETLFEGSVKRDPYLIINTSSPERSLTAFIEIFKRVKTQVPQARAQWAYGWDVWDKVHVGNLKRMEWKEKTVKALADAGIESLGRINHAEVAKLYERAAIFLYPTEFAEIHCISAVKAQAAGANIITTDFSALDETVKYGTKIHSEKTKDTWAKPYQFDFSVTDEKMIDRFVEQTILALNEDEVDWDGQIEWAKETYNWERISKLWHKVFMNQTLPPERIKEIEKWNKDGKPWAYADPKSFDQFPKFPLTLKKIKERKEIKSVLDIGCFTGYFLRHLSLEKNGDGYYDCFGCDIQKDLMDRLNKEWEKKRPNLKFTWASAENLAYAVKSFDAVVMLDTLEHCLDDKKAIAEAEHVLKPGGWMFINLPRNHEYLDDSGEHVRIYDDEYVKELFGQKKNVEIEMCKDEYGRKTTYVTYQI
mgnify:CR=1 FL=1